MAKVVALTPDTIAIVAPYHASVAAEAQRRKGRWMMVKTWVDKAPAWVLSSTHREAMEQLLRDCFPSADALQERTITWVAPTWTLASPTLDGYALLGFRNDRWWPAQFAGGEPIGPIAVIAHAIETGGSRRHPQMQGILTLRLRCRPQAVAGGDGWREMTREHPPS